MSISEEAHRIQKQLGYAERRLRAIGHPDTDRVATILNALLHVMDFGHQYGPQLEGSVTDYIDYVTPKDEPIVWQCDDCSASGPDTESATKHMRETRTPGSVRSHSLSIVSGGPFKVGAPIR